MSSAAFADLIFTGTVRSFYSREKADEFVATVEEMCYESQTVEHPGEDLRFEVKVLGKKPAPKKKK